MRLIVATLVTALALAGPHARAKDPSPSYPAELHFAPEEDLEAIDVGLIDDAGETIDMSAYVLTGIGA